LAQAAHQRANPQWLNPARHGFPVRCGWRRAAFCLSLGCELPRAVLFLFASLLAMVHRHSPAKLKARRRRAAERGFLVPRPGRGRRWLSVPCDMLEDARKVTQSMELHAAHDAQGAAPPHHAARLASYAVRANIGKSEYVKAQKIHKAANAAKHNVGKKAAASARAASCGVPSRPDCWLAAGADPWAQALAQLPAVDSRPLVVVVPPASLRAEAASFVPTAAAAPAVAWPTASRGDLDALAAQLEYALCLLAAQNDTIAQLRGELEARVLDSPAHRGCGGASDPYKYCDTAIEDLHAVVESRFTSFRDVCLREVESIVTKSVTSIVRSSMNGLMQSVDAVRDAVAASCAASASPSASVPPSPRSCSPSLSAAASRGAAPCGQVDAPHMRPARLRRDGAELCPVCGGSEFFISDDLMPCFCSGSPPAGFFASDDDGDWRSDGRWSQ